MEARAFDAARANAEFAAVLAVRALAGQPIELAERSELTSEALAIIDGLDREGKVPGELARDLRALIETRQHPVVAPTDREDAARVISVASRILELARREGDSTPGD